jgi:hypothetical protein
VFAAAAADSGFVSQGDAAYVSGPDAHFEWTGANTGDAILVFVAHYGSDPSEDLEQAVPFYVAGQRVEMPTPARESTWGRVKSLHR